MKSFILLLVAFLFAACGSQEGKNRGAALERKISGDKGSPIAAYVVCVLEDSKGNLWFGTLEKGVAKYDGRSLQYMITEDGLPSNRVVAIVEDNDGTLWFGTGMGLSRYDGRSFTNFSEADGLCHNSISNLLIDQEGTLWIGTWGGACMYDGSAFTAITLPTPAVETPINPDTENWIIEIKEDAIGNIWFGRDGFGATLFKGETFDHYTTEDGLHSNNITEIEEDPAGNIWFVTRVAERDNPDPEKRQGKGGVNIYDWNSIHSFPDIDGFNTGDVYEIYREIWSYVDSHNPK